MKVLKIILLNLDPPSLESLCCNSTDLKVLYRSCLRFVSVSILLPQNHFVVTTLAFKALIYLVFVSVSILQPQNHYVVTTLTFNRSSLCFSGRRFESPNAARLPRPVGPSGLAQPAEGGRVLQSRRSQLGALPHSKTLPVVKVSQLETSKQVR